jgi:hypothetical protein
MIDAEIIQMLFNLLEFGVSTSIEIRDNPEKASASLAVGEFGKFLVIRISVKILDRLCICSEQARARIGQMVEGEFMVLTRVVRLFDDDPRDGNICSALLRVLCHYRGNLDNTLTREFTDVLNLF